LPSFGWGLREGASGVSAKRTCAAIRRRRRTLNLAIQRRLLIRRRNSTKSLGCEGPAQPMLSRCSADAESRLGDWVTAPSPSLDFLLIANFQRENLTTEMGLSPNRPASTQHRL